MMGSRAAGYSGAKHFVPSTERPPVASEFECLGETDLSDFLGLMVLGLQHGVVLAEVFATVDRICSLPGLEVPSHDISLYSAVIFVDDLFLLLYTRLYSSFSRLKIVSYF